MCDDTMRGDRFGFCAGFYAHSIGKLGKNMERCEVIHTRCGLSRTR